eukprot:528586-Pyramimonas_sp.AAC.1
MSLGHLPASQRLSWEWGSLSGGTKVSGGTWGIDGSGGKYHKYWRLRRCGWAIVHLGPDGLFDGVASGTLSTEVQSAGRAELFALIQLERRTVGQI